MALIGACTRALKREMDRFGNKVLLRIPRQIPTLPCLFTDSQPPYIIKTAPKMSKNIYLGLISTSLTHNRRTIVSNSKISNYSARHFSFVSPLALNQYEKVFYIPRYLYGVLFGGALFFGITVNIEMNDLRKAKEAREFVAQFSEKVKNGQFKDVISFLSNSGIMVVGQSDEVISEAVRLLLDGNASDLGHVESIFFLIEICKQLPSSRPLILSHLNMQSFSQKIQDACFHDELISTNAEFLTPGNSSAAHYDVSMDMLPEGYFFRKEWEKRTAVMGTSIVRIYLSLMTELSKDQSLHPYIASDGLLQALVAFHKRKGRASAEYLLPLCLSLSRSEIGLKCLHSSGAATLLASHLIFHSRVNEDKNRVYLDTLNKNELLSRLIKVFPDNLTRQEFLGTVIAQNEAAFLTEFSGSPEVHSALLAVINGTLEYDDESSRRYAKWREWVLFFPFLSGTVLYALPRGHSRRVFRSLGMTSSQAMWTALWRAILGTTFLATAFYLGNNDPFFYGKDSLQHVNHGGWTGFERLFGLSEYRTSAGPEFKCAASLLTSAASIAALLGLQFFSPFTLGQLFVFTPASIITPFTFLLSEVIVPDFSQAIPGKVLLLNEPLTTAVDQARDGVQSKST